MNRWLSIRRLRGPAFLILLGITALLNQWGVLSFWRSWPLYLILAGLLMLAERAALAAGPRTQLPGGPNGPQDSARRAGWTAASGPDPFSDRTPDIQPPPGEGTASGGDSRA